MADKVTELILRGNNRSAIRALTQVADQSEKTARTVKRDSETTAGSFRKVGESGKRLHGVISGLAGTVGLGGLAFGLGDAVKGGIALQAQQAQLAQALKNTGNYSAETAAKLTESAEALSTHGGFGAVQNLQGLTQLVTATKSVSKSTTDQVLATNIARRTGKDYGAIVKAISMLEQGRTTGLSRLGIAIPKVTTAEDALKRSRASHHDQLLKLTAAGVKLTATEKAQLALSSQVTPQMEARAKAEDMAASKQGVFAVLQQRYARSTATYSHSAAGQLRNVSHAASNLADQTGKALLPTLTRLIGVTTTVVSWLNKHRVVLYAILGVTGAVAAILATHAAITAVVEAKTYALAGANRLLGTSFGVAAAGEEGAAAATTLLGFAMDALPILALITGIVLVATHMRQTGQIVITAVTAVWHFIERAAGAIYNALTWPFREAGKLIKHIWHGITSLPGTLLHAGGSLLHSATFGLLHGGGVVKPKYFAAGGPVGTDTVPGWLTPGEGVVTNRGMGWLGAGGLSAVNSGLMWQRVEEIYQMVREGQMIEVHHQSLLDSRILAESVTRYARNRAARGASSLVGGGLLTGGKTG